MLASRKYDELKGNKWDINTICGAFKHWLRDLPDPVCTFELFQDFTELGLTFIYLIYLKFEKNK